MTDQNERYDRMKKEKTKHIIINKIATRKLESKERRNKFVPFCIVLMGKGNKERKNRRRNDKIRTTEKKTQIILIST